MVGKTEEQLIRERVPYEVGHGFFHEIARGQIVGGHVDMLKLLFHRETRRLLGVHCIGEAGTEIVHTGPAVLDFEGAINSLRKTVFNYPPMTESYRVAAL